MSQHDLFVRTWCRTLLDLPAELAAAMSLLDRPPPVLDPDDEAILRRVIALEDVPDVVILGAVSRAVDAIEAAVEGLRNLPRICKLFDQLSGNTVVVDQPYDRAVRVQARRRQLAVVAGTESGGDL